MIDSIEWLRTFIAHYPALQYIVIFLGAGFGGEVAIIFLAFLSAQGVFPLSSFIIISLIAVSCTEIFWFSLGKTGKAVRILNHRYAQNTIFVIAEAIRKISRGNKFLSLILVKFIIGPRVMLIFSFSKSNMNLRKFIYYDFPAIFIWLSIIIPIGFLSGFGFTYVSYILESIYAGIGFVLLIFLIFFVIQLWIKRFFIKEKTKILDENNML